MSADQQLMIRRVDARAATTAHPGHVRDASGHGGEIRAANRATDRQTKNQRTAREASARSACLNDEAAPKHGRPGCGASRRSGRDREQAQADFLPRHRADSIDTLPSPHA
jgi:hypothetical protein